MNLLKTWDEALWAVQRPVIVSMARMAERHSSSSTALNIRMLCVLGSTSRQIRAQSDAMSIILKMKSVMFPNIAII